VAGYAIRNLEILAFGGREKNDAETQPPTWPE
jgi:hypothetical protein